MLRLPKPSDEIAAAARAYEAARRAVARGHDAPFVRAAEAEFCRLVRDGGPCEVDRVQYRWERWAGLVRRDTRVRFDLGGPERMPRAARECGPERSETLAELMEV